MTKIVTLGFSMFLLFMIVFPISGQAAPSIQPGALTSPPPDQITLFTLFDPNFSYLEKGGAYISEMNDGKVNIWGDTTATIYVDEVGVGVTMQRWTGSTWVDVISGTPAVVSNSAYAYASHILTSVSRGYYYRTKSSHWIKYGTVYEGGTRYSGSILLPL